ncbi:D-alanyl-D-alanine carboxypeptidase [Treponema ruminis]|uniref:D-alanyl-D-alanine carboxypeptidase (Penicillin-binding protein 5/6) n=1 Tax=Treponema ruminis TaxID=744515 RepID=A0A7W8G9Z6_9SPIR|nr:D-alanyl-D-alanine carboxypeptidase family protein [Treponema ruminis]MBB5226512.1 D-alanyl-D-alanine carboxypeptidase (penicillin-binding protein 5/6) [Treponema ruminis]QSI02584.1 D-alanyl-D-alanine carboxypeptidase [Treponema ruminis]
MEIYDVTDEFIDERSKKAKKLDNPQKKSKVKFISELDEIPAASFSSKKAKKSAKKQNFFQIFNSFSAVEKTFVLTSFAVIVLAILSYALISYSASFTQTENSKALSPEQEVELSALLNELYPQERTAILKNLPYSMPNTKLDVWAGSAILIDASNGCVLFEKNADAVIPPASIAKLFVMYIVFKDAAEGKISLDDVVPLPERSWAINMPKDASLMFLGQGQIVTLRELLKGLAVASGNDAALAVADYISGSTKAFVERMNEECAALGLTHTHFVEPSGYDEHNLTTARELAAFCCEYIRRFPQSVEEFHSAPSIKYPMGKNLPSWQKDRGDSTAIYQKNTNPLLGLMEGCDGIKTGFIYESRYNLALTAKRNGVRYISVTMMGTGVGSKQGNAGRVHDGTEMMEWAFQNFADFNPAQKLPEFYAVPAIGSKNTNGKFVRLVPAWNKALTVPHVRGKTALEDAACIEAREDIPRFIYGGVEQGKVYGQIQYRLGDLVLETVPLVADRTYERASLPGRIIGALVSWRL